MDDTHQYHTRTYVRPSLTQVLCNKQESTKGSIGRNLVDVFDTKLDGFEATNPPSSNDIDRINAAIKQLPYGLRAHYNTVEQEK